METPEPSSDTELLPHIGPFDFLQNYARSGLWLVYFLFGTLMLCVGLLAVNYTQPLLWFADATQLVSAQEQDVVMARFEHNYRTLELYGQAQYGIPLQNQPLLVPNLVAVVLYAGLQAIGFAALLAASSRIEGLWSYLIYFFFFSHFVLGDFGGLFIEGYNRYLKGALSVAVALPFLVPAFLFKTKSLVWSLVGQFVLYLVLYTGLFASVYAWAGAATFFQVVTFSYTAQAIVAFLFLLFVSKEWLTLGIFLGTNARDQNRRWGLWGVLAWCLGYGAVVNILAFEAWELLPPTLSPYLDPLFFLCTGILMTVVLSQYLHVQWLPVIPSNLGFTTLLLGVCIVVSSTLAYHVGAGELYLAKQLSRTSISLMALMVYPFTAYVVVNFWEELRNRVNFYYGLLSGRRVFFALVWFFCLALFFYYEAQQHYRFVRPLRVTTKNLLADRELLADKLDMALLWYEDVQNVILYDAKANFNAGLLSLTQARGRQLVPEDLETSATYFSRSSQLVNFAAGPGTGAALFLQLKRPREARRIAYRTFYTTHDPVLARTLAVAYQELDLPDSAVWVLKTALAKHPNDGYLWSALAAVYQSRKLYGAARTCLTTAAQHAPKDPTILANALFFHLSTPDSFPLPDNYRLDALDTTQVSLLVNAALAEGRAGRWTAVAQITDRLQRKGIANYSTDLLRMVCDGAQGNLENLEARYRFLLTNYQERAAQIHHAYGTCLHGLGRSDLAYDYFMQGAAQGYAPARLAAPLMLIDQGKHWAQAYDSLSAVMASSPEIRREALREQALITYARTKDTGLPLGWNFRDITAPEALRLARYGRNGGVFEQATRFFEDFYKKDSADYRFFVEMARQYLDAGNLAEAEALITLGLKRAPTNLGLLLVQSDIYALKQDSKSQEATLRTAQNHHPTAWELDLAWARLWQSQGNSSNAALAWQRVLKQRPLHAEATYWLADAWLRTGKMSEAYRLCLLYHRFDRNNHSITFQLAGACKAMGFKDEATAFLNELLNQPSLPGGLRDSAKLALADTLN
jgi:Flp pilus assembly protein TadD